MIGVLLNPFAGAARDPTLARRLQEILDQEAGGEQAVLIRTGSLEELRGALQRLREARVVALCGGDGTLMAAATALHAGCSEEDRPTSAGPPLALLRGGTVNTVARNLGVRGDPEALLRDLLQRLRRAGPAPRPVPLVTVRALGGTAPLVRRGFLFAAAMGARFLDEYYQRGGGRLRAVTLTGATLASTLWPGGGPLARRMFAPLEAEVQVAEEAPWAGPFRLLLCATVADVGMGMRVTWRGGAAGAFHLVASNLPISCMARQLSRVLRGQPLRAPPGSTHIDRLAQQVTLRFAAEQPFTLDGELFHARAVRVSLGPELPLLL